jgi:hypothetical protein
MGILLEAAAGQPGSLMGSIYAGKAGAIAVPGGFGANPCRSPTIELRESSFFIDAVVS